MSNKIIRKRVLISRLKIHIATVGRVVIVIFVGGFHTGCNEQEWRGGPHYRSALPRADSSREQPRASTLSCAAAAASASQQWANCRSRATLPRLYILARKWRVYYAVAVWRVLLQKWRNAPLCLICTIVLLPIGFFCVYLSILIIRVLCFLLVYVCDLRMIIVE